LVMNYIILNAYRETRNAFGFLFGKIKRRDHLEDTGPGPSILLLWIWE